MEDQQWSNLIQELREAISNAKDSQVRFQTNNTNYNSAINSGFENIQNTVREIDGLIEQLTELINSLKRKIADFEAKDLADQTSELTATIADLQNKLSVAQETQQAAANVMKETISTLNANNDAMKSSINSQDVAGLNNNIAVTTTSLEDIKTRLQSLLDETPNNTLPDETVFELPDSDENITYRDLKIALNNKIDQIKSEYGDDMVSKLYKDFYNVINAVNADAESIQNALDKMPFIKGKLQGGKRKRKTAKKRRTKRKKTKKTKKTKKNKRRGLYL
jgi:regulator of replication initiation timing